MKVNLKTDTPSDRELQRRSLQNIANAVESEEQWAAILATAAPEQAEELERVVGPLLPFRRTQGCTTPGCESGQRGEYQPVLLARNPQHPEDVFHVPIELHLCETCKAEAELSDFLTDEIWSQIMLAWPHGEWPPVRRLTRLTFDRTH